MSSHSIIDARPEQDDRDRDLEELHDRTLFAFTSAAEELHKMGYTVQSLARLVERHCTPETVPFAAGEVDPFKGSAA